MPFKESLNKRRITKEKLQLFKECLSMIKSIHYEYVKEVLGKEKADLLIKRCSDLDNKTEGRIDFILNDLENNELNKILEFKEFR